MTRSFDLSAEQTDLLLRYLAGQVTSAEVQDVRRWLAMKPEHGRAFAALEAAFAVRASAAGAAAVSRDEPVPAPTNIDVAWDQLAARLPAPGYDTGMPRPLVLPRSPTPSVVSRSLFARTPSWLRVAAVVALVFSGVVWTWRTTGFHAIASFASRLTAKDREYITRPGERASFALADGTQVLLGVASRLRVPRDFGGAKREVVLEGEAYFTVYHDPGRRFLVYTAHGIAEDVGTRFDVRDYGGDTVARVVVAEGKVTLQPRNAIRPAAPMMLVAGQVGSVTADGTVMVRGGVDVDWYLAWLDGRLVLRDVPLRDAMPELSRWYDLDFRLGDSTLADAGLTATLTNQPVAGALDLLAVALGVRIEQRGRIVTFYRQVAPRIP